MNNQYGYRVLNYCERCKEDFNSEKGFDRHIVGKHEYRWSPERPDGRRHLAPSELEEMGWTRNQYGRWVLPRTGSVPWEKHSPPKEPSEAPGEGNDLTEVLEALK